MKVLEVRNLTKSFGGVRALDDLSFSVAAGETLAMIGPNGAGKTTCFNLVNGQLSPDAGAIELDGRRIAGRAPRSVCRLGVGRTFQVAATFSSMTVRQNIQVALRARSGTLGSLFASMNDASGPDVDQLLTQVGLARQATRLCAEIAYGDLKRVELAIALAGRPRLLLMDEPTAGMAAAERHLLMDFVDRIAKENALSVLFTEHDMDVVFAHADRVMVLAEGRLLAQGRPDAVRRDPRVRQAYLGEGAADA
jgi:branched-chain amino acid transport system ATP-binding protein